MEENKEIKEKQHIAMESNVHKRPLDILAEVCAMFREKEVEIMSEKEIKQSPKNGGGCYRSCGRAGAAP